MMEMTCTIHDVRYGFVRGVKRDHEAWTCPQCMWELIVERTKQLNEATKQRDALLVAIDLKRLQLPHEATGDTKP